MCVDMCLNVNGSIEKYGHILGHLWSNIVHILLCMSLGKLLHMWLVWTLPLNNMASTVFSTIALPLTTTNTICWANIEQISINLLCGLCGISVDRSLAIQKVAGSNLGRSASNSLGQAARTHVLLSPSSIIWYQPMGGDDLHLGR